MWKFIPRGFRETLLERRVCRTNVYSQSSQDGSGDEQSAGGQLIKRCPRFGAPCLSAFYHGCSRKQRFVGHKDDNERNKYDAKYGWSEAVGWSGVLAIGYVVCQSILIRRNIFDIDKTNLEKWRQKLIINPQVHASQLLSHFLLPRPQYILPVSSKLRNEQSNTELTDTSDFSEDLVDGALNIEPQKYGPITAEEALKEAVNEFNYTNDMVVGEVELNYGVKAIEEERYGDAIEHFITGAKMSSAGSMFNLGLCYELGLGTSVDHVKAAKYYKKAADEGHIDAMYNLGVYYAQGKGDIGISLDTARYWFAEAAKKGQVQAIDALKLEKVLKNHSESEPKTTNNLKMDSVKNVGNNAITKLMDYNFFKTNISSQTIQSDEFSNIYDQNLNRMSPTDVFLEMLGAHERNAIPLISVGESGP